MYFLKPFFSACKTIFLEPEIQYLFAGFARVRVTAVKLKITLVVIP